MTSVEKAKKYFHGDFVSINAFERHYINVGSQRLSKS